MSENNSMFDSPESYYTTQLSLYAPPCILAVGTLGNLVSLLVWSRTYSQSSVSTYLYLAVLAVSDMLVLLLGLFKDWMYAWAGYNLSSISQWACKLFTLAGYLSTDYSVWLIIAVTAERYIAVCHPLKTTSILRYLRPPWVLLLLLLLLLAINSHLLLTADLYVVSYNYTDPCTNITWYDKQTICGASSGHEQLILQIWPYVDLCLYSFLPFLVIIVLNSLIIRTVLTAATNRRSFRVSQETSGDVTSTEPTSRTEARLTVMLLTISFTFLLTTSPANVVVILNTYWNTRLHQLSCQHRMSVLARMRLATTATRLLMYTNHSINFVLYCATGYKFREQLRHLLACRRGRCVCLRNTRTDPWIQRPPGNGNGTGTNLEHIPLNSTYKSTGNNGK